MRTYWLSFGNRLGHLGVVVVDVSDADAKEAQERFPSMVRNSESAYVAAAVMATHRAGVNPGGAVASFRVDEDVLASELAQWPRLKLLSQDDCDLIHKLVHMSHQ